MLIIKSTANGYVSNQKICPELFGSVGNTVVRVICEEPYYTDADILEDRICSYMNSFMPNEIRVKTHHVSLDLSTGEDEKGKYVNKVDFQVYI